MGLEVDLQVGKDIPSERVVNLRIGVAVEERRREGGRGQYRRILVEHVVDADLQQHAAEDLIAAHQVQVVPAPQPLYGRSELARQQRRRIGELDLGAADVAPAGLQAQSVPRSRPAGREGIPPFGQRVAAGGSEVPGTVVISGARERLDVEGGRVCAYQIEAQR